MAGKSCDFYIKIADPHAIFREFLFALKSLKAILRRIKIRGKAPASKHTGTIGRLKMPLLVIIRTFKYLLH